MRIPINKQLLDIHRVLSYIKDQVPAIVGHGKLGTSDIHASWREFVARWKSQGNPHLYFVKTDIEHCYDTIKQQKLFEILEKIISKVGVFSWVVNCKVLQEHFQIQTHRSRPTRNIYDRKSLK